MALGLAQLASPLLAASLAAIDEQEPGRRFFFVLLSFWAQAAARGLVGKRQNRGGSVTLSAQFRP